MEPVRIRSGPADVLASGTVIAFEGNPIEFILGPADEQLRLILKFEDEEGKTELRTN